MLLGDMADVGLCIGAELLADVKPDIGGEVGVLVLKAKPAKRDVGN